MCKGRFFPHCNKSRNGEANKLFKLGKKDQIQLFQKKRKEKSFCALVKEATASYKTMASWLNIGTDSEKDLILFWNSYEFMRHDLLPIA